jgi:hypothetical protein
VCRWSQCEHDLAAREAAGLLSLAVAKATSLRDPFAGQVFQSSLTVLQAAVAENSADTCRFQTMLSAAAVSRKGWPSLVYFERKDVTFRTFWKAVVSVISCLLVSAAGCSAAVRLCQHARATNRVSFPFRRSGSCSFCMLFFPSSLSQVRCLQVVQPLQLLLLQSQNNPAAVEPAVSFLESSLRLLAKLGGE